MSQVREGKKKSNSSSSTKSQIEHSLSHLCSHFFTVHFVAAFLCERERERKLHGEIDREGGKHGCLINNYDERHPFTQLHLSRCTFFVPVLSLLSVLSVTR